MRLVSPLLLPLRVHFPKTRGWKDWMRVCCSGRRRMMALATRLSGPRRNSQIWEWRMEDEVQISRVSLSQTDLWLTDLSSRVQVAAVLEQKNTCDASIGDYRSSQGERNVNGTSADSFPLRLQRHVQRLGFFFPPSVPATHRFSWRWTYQRESGDMYSGDPDKCERLDIVPNFHPSQQINITRSWKAMWLSSQGEKRIADRSRRLFLFLFRFGGCLPLGRSMQYVCMYI